jgi:tripartite-type tricarboxylate transporter receptor subunit TctC
LPKGAAAAVVHKLHSAVLTTMNDPVVKTRMQEIGADLAGPDRTSSEFLQKFVEAEIEKWAGPIRATGISAD